MTSIARQFPDTSVARVIGWWFGLRNAGHAAPPLPAWSADGRVVAILRADWKKDGEFIVIDHRRRTTSTPIEFFGAGRSWLGPDWTAGVFGKNATTPRLTYARSYSSVDLVEWSFRAGGLLVTRMALLLRGPKIALLGDEFSGRGLSMSPIGSSVGIHAGITVHPLPGTRAFLLRRAGMKSSIQVIPLGLPVSDYVTDRGAFSYDSDSHRLGLELAGGKHRRWVPWLLSWDGRRHRSRVHWRVLTVTSRSRPCPSSEAFAARVSWGQDETLVVYRSLAAPALRAFLGYQTAARILVGRFTRQGTVEPLVQVD